LPKLLVEHAGNIPNSLIVKRFRSFEESFEVKKSGVPKVNLRPQEAFIFSRFENQALKIHDVQNLSGLPNLETLKGLYVLWLGGFLTRRKWNSAFTTDKIAEITSARLKLKKEEVLPDEKQEIKPLLEKSSPPETVETVKTASVTNHTEEKRAIETYLNRVETGGNYYEIFDIPLDASIQIIKDTYFAYARKFHPDKYHQEADSVLRSRIQNAFTEIARAYETLKSEETRRVYDFKLRKNIANTDSQKQSVKYQNLSDEEKAKDEFEQGFSLLMSEDYEAAMPFLVRAVQMSPATARYHAYYGKLLSMDETQRFKADAEFQTAIRLDPNNSTYRLLLAEFYVQFNLVKRAEGELQRLLAIFPNNKEAKILLDSLPQK